MDRDEYAIFKNRCEFATSVVHWIWLTSSWLHLDMFFTSCYDHSAIWLFEGGYQPLIMLYLALSNDLLDTIIFIILRLVVSFFIIQLILLDIWSFVDADSLLLGQDVLLIHVVEYLILMIFKHP